MRTTGQVRFHKMNGLGNQIVVADLRRYDGPAISSDHARAIAADPRTRFDQLMVVQPPRVPGTDGYIEIFNADGLPAGACGNGMRCVAMLLRAGRDATAMKFETSAGVLDVTFPSDVAITVDMGPPRFGWQDIPLSEEFHDTSKIELQIGPIDAPVLHSPSVCSMGNPHAVFWVDDVGTLALDKFGPLLEHHPLFPERANITVAQVLSRTHVRTRTWERGAGLTRACGSAACATLACGVRTDRLDREAAVSLPGGDLLIQWPQGAGVLMTGPAELEFSGYLNLGSTSALTIEV